MICVSIGRGRHRHMIAEHRHLVEQGAQLVELRLDYIHGQVNLRRLLTDRPCPVIVTCRRREDSGKWTDSESSRTMLLRQAIAEGVEYVDLEEDLAKEIPRFGETKRIISFHDFSKTPEDLSAIHQRLSAADADIVKIATMANKPHDNLRMLQLIKSTTIPTVGMCMGEIGTPSRLLAGRFGSPFTYSTFHHERSLAPGQLSFHEMKNIYRYESVDAKTEVFGVIADPVGQSLSPVLHNAAFQAMGMNRVYLPFRISVEHLEAFIKDAKNLGIRGISVTIPHKESIIRLLTKADGAVRGIGAANTVIFDGDATLGYNTDYRAAMTCIDLALGTDETDETPLSGMVALMLGAGGVSKAIVFGLKRRGADVVVANRTQQRADSLASQFGCRTVPWARRHAISADLIVNGTSVGMHPNVDESPYDHRYLRSDMVVFDTVYNPESTFFIKEAVRQNCKVITGVEMFIRQAAQQFLLFTGQKAPIELLRESLKRATGAVKI